MSEVQLGLMQIYATANPFEAVYIYQTDPQAYRTLSEVDGRLAWTFDYTKKVENAVQKMDKGAINVKEAPGALDRLGLTISSKRGPSSRSRAKGKRVSVTPEMEKTIQDCIKAGDSAADARKKLEAVHGQAPSYQTVLKKYNEMKGK